MYLCVYIWCVSKDIPQRRVKRWSFNVRELLKDAAGREHFRRFLEKEFSAENLKWAESVVFYHGNITTTIISVIMSVWKLFTWNFSTVVDNFN